MRLIGIWLMGSVLSILIKRNRTSFWFISWMFLCHRHLHRHHLNFIRNLLFFVCCAISESISIHILYVAFSLSIKWHSSFIQLRSSPHLFCYKFIYSFLLSNNNNYTKKKKTPPHSNVNFIFILLFVCLFDWVSFMLPKLNQWFCISSCNYFSF